MRDGNEVFKASSSALTGTAIASAAAMTGNTHDASRIRRISPAGLKCIHGASKKPQIQACKPNSSEYLRLTSETKEQGVELV